MNRKYFPELGLFLIWGISILLVNPVGEFPLNDDWGYAQIVQRFCEEGNLTVSQWQLTTLVGQVFWGSLFCKVMGFSFLALRISTLVAGFLALLAFYRIALRVKIHRQIAFLGALLLLFNPLFFSLSFTFMTDVHFLAHMLLAIHFFLRHWESGKWSDLVLATVFSVFATLIRQPGVLVPLSFGLVSVLNRKSSFRFSAVIPFVLCLVTLFIHSLWVKQMVEGGGPSGMGDAVSLFSSINPYQVLTRLSKTFLYAGLFLLPLSVLFWKEIAGQFRNKRFPVILILMLTVTLLLIGGTHYPVGNVFNNSSLGPRMIKDAYWQVNVSTWLPEEAWRVGIKAVSLLGACLMLIPVGMARTRQKAEAQPGGPLFFLFLLLFYTALLIAAPVYFDRYVLPFLCISAFFLFRNLRALSRGKSYLSIGLVSFMALFSICGTKDYLSWSRVRWQAAEYLTQDLKIDKTRIDAGCEFNAWNDSGYWSPRDKNGKSWWPTTDDEYVITQGPLEGYQKLKSFPCSQLLTQNDTIFILKR